MTRWSFAKGTLYKKRQLAVKHHSRSQDVSCRCREQKPGLEQISGAITKMEQVTQKTAASAEEGAAAGPALKLRRIPCAT